MEGFLKRVATYSQQWVCHDIQHDPYWYSARGFAYRTPSIKCEGCALEIEYDQASDPAQFQTLACKAADGHNLGCKYQGAQGLYKQDIFLGSLAFFEDAIRINKAAKLPLVNLEVVKEYTGLDEFKKTAGFEVAWLLALFGWRSSDNKLTCPFCNTSCQIPAQNLTDQKYQKDLSDGFFDPIKSHRYFCLWGNLDIHNKNHIYGWQFCLHRLTKTRPQNKPLGEIAAKMESIEEGLKRIKGNGVAMIQHLRKLQLVIQEEQQGEDFQELRAIIEKQRVAIQQLERDLLVQPRKRIQV